MHQSINWVLLGTVMKLWMSYGTNIFNAKNGDQIQMITFNKHYF